MVPSIGHAWRWIAGGGGFALEEVLRGFITHKRKRDRAKAREALEKSGGRSGVGLMDFQVAEQLGWGTGKARAALKRLEKKGEAREFDGRWYMTGAVNGPKSPWPRRG